MHLTLQLMRARTKLPRLVIVTAACVKCRRFTKGHVGIGLDREPRDRLLRNIRAGDGSAIETVPPRLVQKVPPVLPLVLEQPVAVVIRARHYPIQCLLKSGPRLCRDRPEPGVP